MKSSTKAVLKQRVRTMLDNLGDLGDVDKAFEGEPSRVQMIFHEGFGFILRGEGCQAFDQFVEESLQDGRLASRVSAKYMGEALKASLSRLLANEDLSDPAIESMIDKLGEEAKMSAQPWRVIWPITNLQFADFDSLEIGRVRFVHQNLIIEDIRATMFHVLNRTTHTPEEITSLKQAFADRTLPMFNQEVCAETTIVAEQTKAIESAYEQVETAINLLRCYTHLLFPRGHRVKIGILGSVKGGLQPSIAFVGKERFYQNMQWAGSFGPYELTLEKVAHLRERCALREMSAILKKQETHRTEMERKIATTIRWLGKGVHEDSKPDKFLSFMIALETLFMMPGEGEERIASTIAERVAFLLEHDMEHRQKTFKRVKQFYRLRSRIAHAGKQDVSPKDAAELEWCTTLCLIKMAQGTKQWPKGSDFRDWIECIKFSGIVTT